MTLRAAIMRAALCALSRAVVASPSCAVNASYFPPLTCPAGLSCCAMPATLVCADEAPPCTSCPMCCHSYLNATACAACNAEQCAGHSTIGDAGCEGPSSTWTPWDGSKTCCGRGVPLPASTTLPNCLLIGDSTAGGQASLVASALADECLVQLYESVSSAYEAQCWGTHRASAPDGAVVPWDVIHFNEGLHSLWPRTNVSSSGGNTPSASAYAGVLANWTKVLAQPTAGVTPTLIYASMSPMMQAHWCNPPGDAQNTVELLNALAVRTVRAAGVTRIHDAYAEVKAACAPGGGNYANCSLCDNEGQYACPAYRAAGGICGYHFSSAGWQLMAEGTVAAIRAALAERRARAVAP